jgi:hypothetical protein
MQVSRHVRDVWAMSLKDRAVVAPSGRPRQHPIKAQID